MHQFKEALNMHNVQLLYRTVIPQRYIRFAIINKALNKIIKRPTLRDIFNSDRNLYGALVNELMRLGEREEEEGDNKDKPYGTCLRGQQIVFNNDYSKIIMTEIKFVTDQDSMLPEKFYDQST